MTLHSPAPSTNSAVVGHVEPRLWTPPLRSLGPDTSYGPDLVDFAREALSIELDPWQKWLALHMGELLVDGRPRFRQVMALVARQNGKTLLSKVLTLYWMAIEQVPLVLGLSTDRTYALAAWREVCDMAKASPWLDPKVRKVIGDESLEIDGSRYRFAASNRRAGRSLTVHRLIVDEIREHRDWEAWGASTKAMNAVPDGQVVCISNQGDDGSVVLDALRDSALDFIATGEGDARLGLFEWSAPDGAEPDDPEALAAANPNLGDRVTIDTLLGEAKRVKRAGGEELASFRTEVLCQKVVMLDAAIDATAWAACGTDDPISMADKRRQVCVGIDLGIDMRHASVVAAVPHDGKIHVEVVAAWDGPDAPARMRQELPQLISRVRPGRVGWFPNGPAASLAADLRQGWAPRGCVIEEIKGDATASCMGLAELVHDAGVTHPRDPLLDRHVSLAQKQSRGDAWVFTRKGTGSIDACYALAAAVHLARTAPPPLPPLVIAR